MSLLDISGLTVEYRTPAGPLVAVDGVDLTVDSGEFVGVAGESGCGKTTMAMAVPSLLPEVARIRSGSVRFDGRELVGLSDEQLAGLRWRDIAVVFQGALNALNPVQRVGDQISEPILRHEPGTSRADAALRARELLEAVGIPGGRITSYPHEFSGGMRQRVMIAMALACRPRLVIADEPVTALDVMTQAQILALLRTLKEDFDLAVVMISHDLSVLADICDRVQVMYAGKVAEVGAASTVFGGGAVHPYTQRLLRSYPDIRGPRAFADGIPGYPPNLLLPQVGCRFEPRCDAAQAVCATAEPRAASFEPGHSAACHLVGGPS
jgi:peptide/nickel transport system ATP-binding protein